MRRRDFIRLLGGAAVDVCIDCVQFLARGGRTGPEHQPEWSLAAIAARWGPEWVLVSLGDKEAYGSWSPRLTKTHSGPHRAAMAASDHSGVLRSSPTTPR